jgi:hypothetical protein
MKRIRFLALALLAAGAAQADDSALPPVQRSGDIRYLSGGIGLDESQAIRAAAPSYALSLVFVSTIAGHGTYNTPDQLTILRADGAPVLDLKPDGPFALIDLPPGQYRVSAGGASQSKTQTVQIARGAHKKLVFELPESGQ